MPNWFKFSYRRYLEKDLQSGKLLEVFRPTVPIQISYKGNLSFSFQALVDSGSDRNLFPASLGEYIGIEVRNGLGRKIGGIGGFVLKAYVHKIKMHFAGYAFETEADFSYE